MDTCENCGAKVPQAGVSSDGRHICCAHCTFNPMGCRCRFGEYGVAETDWWYQDEIPDSDYDDDEDYELGWMEDYSVGSEDNP